MMRLFLRKILLFACITTVAYSAFMYWVMPVLLEAAFGMNVEDQIDMSFKGAKEREYELLILGNSKFYCGVNPDKFDVKAYNFAHNNDTYNQMYYKLRWLESQGKQFRYLILGTDYFQFGFRSDTRNYAYGKYLGKDYLNDYPYRMLDAVEMKLDFLKPYRFRRLLQFPYEKHGLKENGQYVRLGVAEEEDFQKRGFKFLDLQVRYFDKIIEHAQTHNIHVFICMPPMRDKELGQYTAEQIETFHTFINDRKAPNVHYLDFSTNRSFSMSDFIDMTHLNQSAADKFTGIMNDSVQQNIEKNRALYNITAEN